MEETVIIGSGPAGAACAAALLKRGKRVVMLDGGHQLDGDAKKIASYLKNTPVKNWDKEILNQIRETKTSMTGGLPIKYVFGSSYPYKQTDELYPIQKKGTETLVSLALGGLTNVWGAAILPFRQQDIDSWPITSSQLQPYYAKVAELLYVAQKKDDLQKSYPLYGAESPLKMSTQAKKLLLTAQKNQKWLHQQGITIGQSRLAVNKKACVSCGICSYGCPFKAIYNSAYTVEKMRADKRFTYIPKIIVQKLSENKDSVTIHAIDSEGLEKKFKAKNVFLAAGVIGTASIMLASSEKKKITFHDTQYFLLPALQTGRYESTTKGLHTMAQAFIEIQGLSKHSTHIQAYTYNEMFEQGVRDKFGRFASILLPFVRPFFSRLVILIGFIHSEESPQLKLTKGKKYTLTCIPNKATKRLIQKIFRKLRQSWSHLGLIPLTPFATIGTPGRSFHYGGSFPMSDNPKNGETDLLGRPKGWSRTHIVDSSTFPSVPAGTIVFTIMANAYRIAMEAQLE